MTAKRDRSAGGERPSPTREPDRSDEHDGLVATYYVTRVRRELSEDASHRHIEGVCTRRGIYYTRAEVVLSLLNGHIWQTLAGRSSARILTTARCPHPDCALSPYIATDPAADADRNLENLDDC